MGHVVLTRPRESLLYQQMNALYANAIDSLRIGCAHTVGDPEPAQRKQAILTIFHAIELLLKERLYREHPLLIYKDLNAKIRADSFTVGVKDALTRLESIGITIPKAPRDVIEKLQGRRNRIEHHRYDEEEQDHQTISECIAFSFFFIEAILEENIHKDFGADLMRDIQSVVFSHDEQRWAAMFRLEKWLKKTWPEWDPLESDMPEQFEGTLDCPVCRQEYLSICEHREPFCFYCNTTVDAVQCAECGFTYIEGEHICR